MKTPQPYLIVRRIVKDILRLLFFLCLGFAVKCYLVHHYSLDLNYFWDHMFACFSGGLCVILAKNFPDIVSYMSAPNSGGAGTNQVPNQVGAGTNQVSNQAEVGANPPLPNGTGGDAPYSEHPNANGTSRFTVADPTGVTRQIYRIGRLNTCQPYARNLADTLQHMWENAEAGRRGTLSDVDATFTFVVCGRHRIRGDGPEL